MAMAEQVEAGLDSLHVVIKELLAKADVSFASWHTGGLWKLPTEDPHAFIQVSVHRHS